jgi:hypothetical protein
LLKSAKGAERTKPIREPMAPHSVLRELLKSAKGAERTKPIREPMAPHSVLRELLKVTGVSPTLMPTLSAAVRKYRDVLLLVGRAPHNFTKATT